MDISAGSTSLGKTHFKWRWSIGHPALEPACIWYPWGYTKVPFSKLSLFAVVHSLSAEWNQIARSP
jgi:hypothetical protein